MLSNKIGYAYYILARNDWVWEALSAAEKNRVLEDNYSHNNEREDYANPEKYKNGQSIYGDEDPTANHVGQWLFSALEKQKPKKILEIGPGSGFYTKLILKIPSITSYTAIDINGYFLNYIRDGVEKWKQEDSGNRDYQLIHQRMEDCQSEPFDAIVMMSTIHHIPDRKSLFLQLSKMLKLGGKVYSEDPTHYIPRINELWEKLISIYWPKKFWKIKGALATHHFCTLGEFKKVCHQNGDLTIDQIYFHYKNHHLKERLEKWGFTNRAAQRWASKQVLAEFIKK